MIGVDSMKSGRDSGMRGHGVPIRLSEVKKCQLVAVQISYIATIKLPGNTLARRAFTGGSQLDGLVINSIYSFFRTGRNGHHVAITRIVGFTIERLTYCQ